jgi:hypothetical protein
LFRTRVRNPPPPQGEEKMPIEDLAKKLVDNVSIAMQREKTMRDVIMIFLAKIKEYEIKLTDEEKKAIQRLLTME